MTAELDLLVLGSGVAGLSAAVRAAGPMGLRVGLLTKGVLDQATTRWAQGGVAAVLDEDPDSLDLHISDTLEAGADLCDSAAVRVLVDEGPRRVHELIAFGAVFDLDARGELALAREGGHSEPRIVHAGGAATGVEVERALVAAARATAAEVYEHTFAVDLLVEGGRCRGVTALTPDGSLVTIRARHTLLATGGAGQVFAVTTNPAEATGDGIAMALRAGAVLADVEFVQFHPTALHHPQMPRPLLSEALRGHGALLRDNDGNRFVDELLPRDQVSRAMTAKMIEQDVEHLWLDATVLENFDERFPTIAASLTELGLDPATDWLPIAPAAHYTCGGMVTDLDGAVVAPRPVGRGRGHLHGRPRGQPTGVQLAAGGHGLRAPRGRGDRAGPGRPGVHRRHALGARHRRAGGDPGGPGSGRGGSRAQGGPDDRAHLGRRRASGAPEGDDLRGRRPP